jgi:hypothetical protein
VDDALDGLVKRGVLQRYNQIDIEALLNPTDEMEHIDKTTDKEIFKAVMDAHEKHKNIDITGSDDVDDSSPIKHCPTSCKALQAISLITDYTDFINDPIACKLKALLGHFSRQISVEQSRGMKETIITDYFHHL